MSLDDIIKKGRKDNKQQGGKKGGIARKGKIIKKGLGNKKAGGQKPATKATERLVQKLVKKALAQNTGPRKGANQQNRVVRKAIRQASGFRGVNRRSQVIKKGPRNTETVVIKEIVQKRPQPRPQQIVREVIVQQQPARQRFVTQPVRRFNNNKPRIVYVEKRGPPQRQSFGGAFRQQRPRFQQRRQNTDPFYEPANYLQRF